MNTSLSTLVSNALPTITKGHVTYNATRNMYLTDGYTSNLGHTYYQGIHLSDRIAITFDIGHGSWGDATFLNGVSLFAFNGNQKVLIGKWAPSSYAFYSDNLAYGKAEQLLFDYLKSQMQMRGGYISDDELRRYAKVQVEAVKKFGKN
jgi:hypothetical protein